MSEAQAAAMDTIYRKNRINGFMSSVAEKLVAHNAQVIAIDPAGPGAVRCYAFSPFEFDVQFNDPLKAAGSIQDADRVELRVPVAEENGHVMFGKRVYTKTEAWTETPGGQRKGIFSEDMTHPFGKIPLVGIRREEAAHGYWSPSLPYDLLSVAIAVMVSLSDILHIASRQCHGREYIIGNGARAAAKTMPMGVDYITAIESADANDLEHKFVQGDPKIDKYLKAVERVVQIFATNRNVSSESLLNSTGITGVAKELELHDREVERRRVERIHEDAESDLSALIWEVMRSTGSNPVLSTMSEPDLRVDFRYVQRPQNNLQEAQANEIRFRQGLDSVEEFVSRTEGLSSEDARSLIDARLKSTSDRLAAVGDGGHGLNKIASVRHGYLQVAGANQELAADAAEEGTES
tara:strand:- start:103 stop:1323 length:1221 start_codon:yes stop_codon:yes gene_type:complete